MVKVSMVMDDEDIRRFDELLLDQHPELVGAPHGLSVPQPSQLEARLYEVMPYPRYPRYFRRHWW
jgi:hypothetical protein